MKNRIIVLSCVCTFGLLLAACSAGLKTTPAPVPTDVSSATLVATELPTALPLTITTESPTAIQHSTESQSQQWTGTIKRLPAGAQFDDYFESDSADKASFGIDGATPEINAQIALYRDSGTLVIIEGELTVDIPDYNGSQIRVTQLSVR